MSRQSEQNLSLNPDLNPDLNQGARGLSNRLLRSQLARELRILVRSPADVVNPLMFFALGVMLFAVGLRGEREVLAEFAPVVIWVLVLLANLLSLENLYRRDFEDGSLEQLVLLAKPGFLAVLGKILAHWLQAGLWLCLVAPLAGLALFLSPDQAGFLFITLLLGTPALSLLGSVGAALTVGLGRGGVLLAVLVLPLYLPVLIFGASAVLENMAGFSTSAQIYWLASITMLALTLAPLATLAALRISVEQ